MTVPADSFMRAVFAAIGAVEAKTVPDKPDEGAVLWMFGRKFLPLRPPRYVWYLSAINAGPPYHGAPGGSNPSVATGREILVIDSWGRTFDEAYYLRQRLIFKALAEGEADAQWLGDRPVRDGEGEQDYGNAYETRLSIEVPVVDAPLAVVSLQAVQNTSMLTIGGVDVPVITSTITEVP